MVLYLTCWYPSNRRGGVIALFMTGIPIAGVIGGPLSGWILRAMSGVQGLAGWQWMFLIEAIPSLVLGAIVLGFLDNGIEHPNWLEPGEKATLRRNVDQDGKSVMSHSMRDGFTGPRVWQLCTIHFSSSRGSVVSASGCRP